MIIILYIVFILSILLFSLYFFIFCSTLLLGGPWFLFSCFIFFYFLQSAIHRVSLQATLRQAESEKVSKSNATCITVLLSYSQQLLSVAIIGEPRYSFDSLSDCELLTAYCITGTCLTQAEHSLLSQCAASHQIYHKLCVDKKNNHCLIYCEKDIVTHCIL